MVEGDAKGIQLIEDLVTRGDAQFGILYPERAALKATLAHFDSVEPPEMLPLLDDALVVARKFPALQERLPVLLLARITAVLATMNEKPSPAEQSATDAAVQELVTEAAKVPEGIVG